jgi:hypothetical protein
MEAGCSCRTLVSTLQTAWSHTPEGSNVNGLRITAEPHTVCVSTGHIVFAPELGCVLNIILCVQDVLGLICIFSLRFFMVFLSPSTKILVFCIRMGHDHILHTEQVVSIGSASNVYLVGA